MKLLQAFYLYIILLLTPNLSFADLFEGTVIKKPASDYLLLRTEAGRVIELRPNQNAAQDVMLRLEPGDFVSCEGINLEEGNVAYVNSINSVGLRKILGLWRTTNWDVFEFQNFNRLNLYMKNFNTRFSPRPQPKVLDYSISPNSDSDWSILIVDDNSVEVGKLTLNKNQLTIQLFDRQTGRISFTINLQPIAPRR